MKVPNPLGSEKDIAKDKGVVGDDESEGSRMANLRPDEQKPHRRLTVRIRLLDKPKSHNYTESPTVNVAGRWRERLRSYPGRSHGRIKLKKKKIRDAVETRFVMRSQPRS